jgi:DNA-directed RNA polymerase delta subunit
MSVMDYLQQQLRTLRLVETAKELPDIIQLAEKEEVTYREFLDRIVTFEQKRRDAK